MLKILKIMSALKKTYDHLCQGVMEQYQITRSELDILLFLHNNPEFDSAKDIVEKRGIIKSHVSMGIENLINKGYLLSIQDSKDKRRYHLKPTARASAIIEAGLVVQKELKEIVFKDFSEEEIKIFNDLNEKIYQNVKEVK